MENRDGIWIIDTNGVTIYASQCMADILKTTVAALMGKPSFEYVFPEDVADAQRFFESKKRGDMDPFHFKLRCVDGSSVNVRVQGTPIRGTDGLFSGIVGTFSVAD